MMASVPHVTSGLGLRKFHADGFLLTRVYMYSYLFLFVCLYYSKDYCHRVTTQLQLVVVIVNNPIFIVL